MYKIQLPKKVLIFYLIIAPLSCLLFLPYINGAFWMFFSCLFSYFIQLAVGSGIVASEENVTYKVSINDEGELEKLDAQYKTFRVIAISIIALTMILDTFPFWATSSWFCYNAFGLYIP